MTKLQEILQKLSELERKTDQQFAEIDTKLSEFRGEVNTKFAEIDTKLVELTGKITTKSATIEGKLDTQLVTVGGKLDNLSERIKLIEVNAGKIIELAEKVGETQPWRIVQPFVTGFVTLLIGSWINWLLGVYQVVR